MANLRSSYKYGSHMSEMSVYDEVFSVKEFA